MRGPGVGQLGLEVVDPPEEDPAENCEENGSECEEGDETDLYGAGEKVGEETGGVLTLSVLPGSPPPLCLLLQVVRLSGAGGGVQSQS